MFSCRALRLSIAVCLLRKQSTLRAKLSLLTQMYVDGPSFLAAIDLIMMVGVRRWKGCHCSQGKVDGICGTEKCPCRRANRECDPDLCVKCKARQVIDASIMWLAL
jgi:hypothetical protein